MDGISETIAVALQADAVPLGRSRELTGLAGPGGASSDRRRKSISPTMFAAGVRLVDTACALVSLSLIWECAADSISALPHLHLASLIGTVTVLVCMAHGGYAVADLRDLGKQARALAGSLCLGLFAAGGVLFVLQDSHALSRHWLWAWLVASSVLLSGWRVGLRAMLAVLDRSGSLSRRIAVIGSPDLAGRVATQVNAIPADWRLVGLYDDHFEPLGSTPRVGLLDEMVERCQRENIDAVVIAVPLTEPDRITALRQRLNVLATDVYLLADVAVTGADHLGFAHVANGSALLLQQRPLHEWQAMQKRIFDLVLASMFLVILAPVMVAIAIAIKLTSSGPALFRQPRVGLNSQSLQVLKFRSMYHHCADLLADAQATRHDPRVTPIGRWLRRFSLDELPQLLNVLGGSMSIVGPRPHAPNTKAAGLLFSDVVAEYSLRHRVKPGITGWAQVNGWRGETRTVEQIEGRVIHDLYYIENWSLLLDARIVLMTVLGGFGGPQAY